MMTKRRVPISGICSGDETSALVSDICSGGDETSGFDIRQL